MIYSLQIFLAIILDAALGDPRSWPHPVKMMGRLCEKSEYLTRKLLTNEFMAGCVTVLIVLSVTLAAVLLILLGMAGISRILADITAIFFIYTSVAARDLCRHSEVVYQHLQAGNLAEARKAVSMIVGRDTEILDSAGVSRACVETVAENSVDGVIAPLFWGMVCGLLAPICGLSAISGTALGAVLYKAVNTMDSMIGYKNDRYLHFGRAAARLDDVCNFLPARLSPIFLAAAALLLSLDARQSLRIVLRDRLRHASPNAGHPEAAVAGALGVRLGGPSRYFGGVVDKAFIGDDRRPLTPQDILTTNRLMYLGSLLFILFMLAGRFLVTGLI